MREMMDDASKIDFFPFLRNKNPGFFAHCVSQSSWNYIGTGYIFLVHPVALLFACQWLVGQSQWPSCVQHREKFINLLAG